MDKAQGGPNQRSQVLLFMKVAGFSLNIVQDVGTFAAQLRLFRSRRTRRKW
jgi:hypothetical protein